MKKLRYIFSFLNKKGVFALGLVIGIISVLFFSKIVFAEETTLPGDMVQICYIPGGYELYVHASDFDVTKMAWGKNNGSDYSWSYVGPNLSQVYYRNSPDKALTPYYNYNNLSMTPYTEVPITCASLYVFNSVGEAQAYINGEIDASSALNYEEVQKNNKDYDSSIPVPVKAYINVITNSTVSSVFSYDETELENFKSQYGYELQYEYEVEYFYQMLSKLQINNQKSNLVTTEKNKDSNSYSLDENGLFVSSGTAGELYETFSANQLIDLQYCNATADTGPYSCTGVVALDNAVTSSPPNYYELYSIPFSLTSMEYHMQFILAQVRISTFYVDDSGMRHYSDDIYIRRSLWDKDNDLYGSTYTRITKDENGNDTFQFSHVIDSNGNDVNGVVGSFSVDSVEQYIKNGYGLTGSDGYIEMSRRFFIGVPEYIWTIIAFALTINVIVILFKILRGM